jgi:hypothetical protein
MKQLRAILFIAALCAVPAAAQPQPAEHPPGQPWPPGQTMPLPTPPQGQQRESPQPLSERINLAIAELETSRFGTCAEGREITPAGGGESAYPLATDRQMRDGGVRVYRYVFNVTGCGRPARTHNIEVLRHDGLEPLIVPLPMGRNAATSNMVRGVVTTIFTPMMRERYSRCEVRNLKILEANNESGTPFRNGENWTERWLFDACGARGAADITFSYDGRGLRTTAQVATPG